MKKNAGITMVEIILSICIIAIVIVFLFSMLIQVREEDEQNNIESSFIIAQSTFIKSIEEDIVNYGVKAVGSCTLADVNISDTVVSGYEDNYKCIRIEYAADYIKDKVGYLLVYNYYTHYDVVDGRYQGRDPSWMIQYVRGSYGICNATSSLPIKSSWSPATTMMRELPDEIDLSDRPYVLYTASQGNSHNAASIVLPIMNMQAEHYDINLSFTFMGNNNFTCYNDDDLACNCTSANSVCQNTIKDQDSNPYKCT